MMGNQLSSFIFNLVGSVVGAHLVARCEQRSIIIKAGVSVGGSQSDSDSGFEPDLREIRSR